MRRRNVHRLEDHVDLREGPLRELREDLFVDVVHERKPVAKIR